MFFRTIYTKVFLQNINCWNIIQFFLKYSGIMLKNQRNNPLSITSLFIQDNLFMVLNLSITRTIDHRVCCYILIKPPYLIHLSYKDKTQKQHNNQNRPRTILMWNEILLNRTFLGRI